MQIDRGFTTVHEQTLRSQLFGDLSPGPILHDFQVVLDYLGTDGVKAAGKYNLLPIEAIPVLDERLARPLRLELRRPQLRSHPYLQGLHLLLRATGIVRIRGTGAKAWLAPDPAVLQRWQELNPTERYFALLESWLLIGEREMIGERERGWNDFLSKCLLEWRMIPDSGKIIWTGRGRPDMIYLRGIERQFYMLALMDLFGLVRVQHPEPPPQPWVPAGISRTPFGDAVFTLLADAHYQLLFAIPGGGPKAADEPDEHALPDEDVAVAIPLADKPMIPAHSEATDESDPSHDADLEENDLEGHDHWLDLPDESAGFGFWQPLFQPYFAAWQHCLASAQPQPRTGMFIFRVSLGRARREIAMPDDATVEELVQWILRSVKFDSEHLYELTYRDHLGRKMTVNHPACDEPPWADEIHIGELPIEPDSSLQLLYDFGDSWRFDIRLERIEAGSGGKRVPRIMTRQGASPKQYESW